jgi:uncharacterized PurR-regulated membrane protein YhhQ (DUF165 family)
MGFWDNDSENAEVLGLDALSWLFALVSGIVGGVTDTLIFDNMAATAQKAAYPELALALLALAGFIMSGGTLFGILTGLRKKFGW